jgi:hypothetical protein
MPEKIPGELICVHCVANTCVIRDMGMEVFGIVNVCADMQFIECVFLGNTADLLVDTKCQAQITATFVHCFLPSEELQMGVAVSLSQCEFTAGIPVMPDDSYCPVAYTASASFTPYLIIRRRPRMILSFLTFHFTSLIEFM